MTPDSSVPENGAHAQGAEQRPGLTREQIVDFARERWCKELVDMSARNQLLYYKDLKASTLAFDSAKTDLLDSLLAGKTLKTSDLFESSGTEADAARRAKTIRAKAKEAKEELGIQTLHIAYGLATWTPEADKRPPCAPILVAPLEITPAGAAQTDFKIKLSDAFEINPVLLQRLATLFSLEIDPGKTNSQLESGESAEARVRLDEALAWMAETCESVPGFSIDRRAVARNFSYAKLPMVRDLQESLDQLIKSDLVAALAGDSDAQTAVRSSGSGERIPSPDETPSRDEFLVLDADSSQNYAINAVLGGQNMIIQGPPGTGKSQTIANLIAALIARRKRVLFVAEKRAAIDAVLGRLKDVGLDDLVMDLHASRQSKRATAESIAAALKTNGRIVQPSVGPLHLHLDEEKARLNEHSSALHEPRPPWNISFFDASSDLLNLGKNGRDDLRLDRQSLMALNEAGYRSAQSEIKELAALSGLQLQATGSPWSASAIEQQSQVEEAMLVVERAMKTLQSLIPRINAAQEASGFPISSDRGEWNAQIVLWQETSRLLDTWQPNAFELPVDKLLGEAEDLTRPLATRTWAAISDGTYRSAKRQLRGALRQDVRLSSDEIHSSAIELQACREELEGLTGSTSARLPEDLTDLADENAELGKLLRQVARLTGSEPPVDVDETEQWLRSLLVDKITLARLPRIAELKKGLASRGFGPLLDDLAGRDHSREEVLPELRRVFLRSFIEHFELSDERIYGFDEQAHTELSASFAKHDSEHIHSNAQRVRRICAEAATVAEDNHPEAARFLRNEASKKKRIKPLREIFEISSDVLLSLKPCWAMSPLVVSQMLPAGDRYFDLVIFDEGSQVRPADSIPAIMRAKQVVVAGDKRQLPPTDFYALTGFADEEEDDDERPAISMDGGHESILDGLGPHVVTRSLMWHYRSRDEKLIAFSNAYIYDSSLTTFPGTGPEDSVRHVLVQSDPLDTNSGLSSANEVRRVVDLILEHSTERPKQSLGVITMGIKHANRIDAALRKALAERGNETSFFNESRDEPFFIKNLERVQGDERDAIILSLGYGKTQDGKMQYQFGPINKEGGERRLNVAVTRAKESMTFVSSFSHLDMDPNRCNKDGVRLLREYLSFCASGGSKIGESLTPPPELNPFEIEVRDALQLAGIPLVAQHGSSGYRIDFAAQHPERPGQFVLAIECDGASYHSSQSARDRDRLRQEHLERLGWRFHRIWSQSWFRDREAEVKKARQAYLNAVAEADSPYINSSPPRRTNGVAMGRVSIGADRPKRADRPSIQTDRGSIDRYTDQDLRDIAKWIASDGRLRSEEDWAAAIRKFLGFQRNGVKIQKRISAAISHARAVQTISGSYVNPDRAVNRVPPSRNEGPETLFDAP